MSTHRTTSFSKRRISAIKFSKCTSKETTCNSVDHGIRQFVNKTQNIEVKEDIEHLHCDVMVAFI